MPPEIHIEIVRPNVRVFSCGSVDPINNKHAHPFVPVTSVIAFHFLTGVSAFAPSLRNLSDRELTP